MVTIPKSRTTQCYREIGGVIKYKKKHKTDKEAIEEAKLLNNKPTQIHKVVAYKCAICGSYHVGKSLKELEKKENIYAYGK